MDNQRNIILAVVLTALVLFGWDAAVRFFYPQAEKPAEVASTPDVGAPKDAADAPLPGAEEPGQRAKPTREGGLTSAADIALEKKDLKQALSAGGRLTVEAPGLSGSVNLTGAIIDDLVINRHTQSVKKGSGPERIFSPPGTPAQHFAQFGWVGQGVELPDAESVWSAPAGAKLTPETPVELSWSNAAGQTFGIRLAIDKDYMITAKQTVVNRGDASVVVRPFALINRTDKTASLDSFNVHSGPLGVFDDTLEYGPDYDDVRDEGTVNNEGRTSWVGFTDVYWLSALIPGKLPADSDFRALPGSNYRADLLYDPMTVSNGKQISVETRLFAGAKESEILDRYEETGIPKFSRAIDWGWFEVIEKPILWLLKSLFSLVGNFGVAIILLTVIVRGIMFPVAQRQFASMAAMRAVQPKMKAIQERYKDDKQKQQQEVMALYKKEGVNPLAGCLPIFLQIPIFFALYKVLILSIEMRHQPFILWIKDLSAPDPLHILNLFGLLPFTPPSFLGIGVLALLLGVTMFFQFKMNPAPMDPMQEQMFKFMPWVMMFIMAPFAAGLLIYWTTSNLLTIAQQKYLYSRHPQLKAQADKDAVDEKRAKDRDKPAKADK